MKIQNEGESLPSHVDNLFEKTVPDDEEEEYSDDFDDEITDKRVSQKPEEVKTAESIIYEEEV